MPQLGFGAQLEDWVRRTEQRMNAVFRESAQRTISLTQSYVPVDTGFLRASVRVSLQSMPQIEPKATGGTPPSSDEYTLSIAGAEVGDTIYAGYTAAYARYVHDGTSKMAGMPFVYLAALQWPRVVNEVQQELKGRVLGPL